MRIVILALCLSVLAGRAWGVEAFIGKVTVVEPTYLPAEISFQMDNGNAACPANTWIKWSKADKENNLAVYSTLLAALVSGKSIRLYIDDDDTSCKGQYLHLFAN